MRTNLGDHSRLLLLIQRLDLLYCFLIRIERRTELSAIEGPPVKIMANQMDGILILSLEAKGRAPGFSGLRVICARIRGAGELDIHFSSYGYARSVRASTEVLISGLPRTAIYFTSANKFSL
jgi:hypothetical protein